MSTRPGSGGHRSRAGAARGTRPARTVTCGSTSSSRDSTDARLLTKLWRFIWYKDSGPTLLADPGRAGRAPGVRRCCSPTRPGPASGPPRRRRGGLARRRHRRRAEPARRSAQRPGAGSGDRRRPRRRLVEPAPAPRRAPRPRQPLGGQRRARRRRDDGSRRARGCAQLGLRRPPPTRPCATARHHAQSSSARTGRSARPSGRLPDDELVDLLGFLEPTALTSAAKRHVTKAKTLLKPASGTREPS